MALKLKITQVKSGIGRPDTQRRTLAGLGLGKLHKSVVLEDTPSIRGMIFKVSHLVTISPVE
jgi:large subunit ribosomal protein L30